MHLKPLSELFGPSSRQTPASATPPAVAPAKIPAAKTPTAQPPADALAKPPRQGTSQLNLDFVEPAKPVAKPAVKPTTKAVAAPASGPLRDIDSQAVFTNGEAATGKEIDAVLKHYGSPHAGKGETIARICREQHINPILLIAVMQQESSFGNKNNLKTLKPENIANPWSVHFNEKAKGIAKLRLKDGSSPTFEQSLNGAIHTLKKLAGSSATPLSTAGSRYSTTGSWTQSVKAHYQTQLNRILKQR